MGHKTCENGHETIQCPIHGRVEAHQPKDGSHAKCSLCENKAIPVYQWKAEERKDKRGHTYCVEKGQGRVECPQGGNSDKPTDKHRVPSKEKYAGKVPTNPDRDWETQYV